MQRQKLLSLHPDLDRLPVAQQLEQFDFDRKHMLGIAETGAGKTMVVPAAEAMLRADDDITVVVRQPTKVATGFCYSGLQHFWGDKLKIAISTRDQKEGLDEDPDVIVMSDGSLRSVMKSAREGGLVGYFDELHVMGLVATEVELGVCKRLDIPIRGLTATIDPTRLATYLGPDTDILKLSGRSHPIEKTIREMPPKAFSRDDLDAFWPFMMDEIVFDLMLENESAIVFLPTKDLCEEAARRASEVCDATFAHGEVYPPDLEMWCDERQGNAYVVFATIAAATSITIDVGRVYILDERRDSVVRRGVMHTYPCPVDDNTLLQMAGRCGRLRPGEAILLVSQPPLGQPQMRDWADVIPRDVTPPAEKATPFEVVLSMSHYGLRRGDPFDILSRLDQGEIDHAYDWLIESRCLDDEGALTSLGEVVERVPLEAPMAHLVATAPGGSRVPLLASAILQSKGGAYGMLRAKPGSPAAARAARMDPTFEVFPSHLVVPGSMPLTMANVMREAMRGDVNHLAGDCNLNPKILRFALKETSDGLKQLRWDRKELFNADLVSLVPAVEKHMRYHKGLRWAPASKGEWFNFNVDDNLSLRGTVDSVSQGVRGMWPSDAHGGVVGVPRVFQSRNGKRLVSLDWPTFIRGP